MTAVIAAGSYAGDGVADRAVPHGMGVTPNLVIIRTTCLAEGVAPTFFQMPPLREFIMANSSVNWQNQGNVTAADDVNFHVSTGTDYGNRSGCTYYWIAFGVK